MLPTKAITTAFPVPTSSNPDAVFVKEKIVEFSASSDATVSGRDTSRQLREDLARARNDLRAKVSEDFRRRQDIEACKRKWRGADAAKSKEEKQKELDALGLPESCAYLLDTAQFAMRQYRESNEATSEVKDQAAASYDSAVKRILGDKSVSGADRLRKDLDAKANKNAKRARATKDVGEGVNIANAKFLKAVEKSTNKDARAQIIKQNLERGTAL